MKNAVQFLREVQLELSKVVWPKFDEWIGSTIIVLVLTTFFALYLWMIDLGFNELARYVFTTYGGQ